jgi:hypothetical protein
MAQPSSSQYVSIDPTLNKLAKPLDASNSGLVAEIANALSLLLDGKLSETQAAALLSLLHHREKDKDIVVILECIHLLAPTQAKVDTAALNRVISDRNLACGQYQGGLASFSPQKGLGVI